MKLSLSLSLLLAACGGELAEGGEDPKPPASSSPPSEPPSTRPSEPSSSSPPSACDPGVVGVTVVACDLPDAVVVGGDDDHVYLVVWAAEPVLSPWIDAATRFEPDSDGGAAVGALLDLNVTTAARRAVFVWRSSPSMTADSAASLRAHVQAGVPLGRAPAVVSVHHADEPRVLRWLDIGASTLGGESRRGADPGFWVSESGDLVWHSPGREGGSFTRWNPATDAQPWTFASGEGRIVGSTRGAVTLARDNGLVSYGRGEQSITWGLGDECTDNAWVEEGDGEHGHDTRVVCAVSDADGYRLFRFGDRIEQPAGEQVIGVELASAPGRRQPMAVRRHEGGYVVLDAGGIVWAADIGMSMGVLSRLPAAARLQLPVPVGLHGANGRQLLATTYAWRNADGAEQSALVLLGPP